MRAIIGAVVLSVVLAAVPASAATDVTYFLHATGSGCTGDAEITYFVDPVDSSGDLDGCGAVGAGPAGAFSLTFSGTGPLNVTIPKGQSATVRIFLSTAQPDRVSVDASFSAGAGSCGGSSEELQLVNAYGAVNDYTEFTIACTFGADVPATATPSVSVAIHSSVTFFFGYEDDHASRIDLGSLAEPVPANGTGNETSPPAGDTPGPGVAIALGLVAFVALIRRRR